MMKIVLIGATGYVGAAILEELLSRGHQVTAIMRHPEKLLQRNYLQVKKADVFNTAELTRLIANHDAVISAFNGFNANLTLNAGYQAQLNGVRSIVAAVKNSGVNCLLMVGGAGSLEVAPGQLLLNTPEFPKEWKEMASAMTEVLALLKKESELDWTFLSPAAFLYPGVRTGKFRLGGDQPIRDEQGESKISTQDYAVAMVDELENPQHRQQRFTVGYSTSQHP